MIKSIFSLVLLLSLYSCGSDNGPSGSNPNPLTPGLQNLENMTEVSIDHAMQLLQSYSSYNQVLNPGDQYTSVEVSYQGFNDQEKCKIETTTTYTVINYDQISDRLTSLVESEDDYSVGDCIPSGDTTFRYLRIESNYSQKLSFDSNFEGETRVYRGTINGEVYLYLTSRGNTQGLDFKVDAVMAVKRPLWSDPDQVQILLGGELYSTSNSGSVTNVDISNLDTTGLSTINIDHAQE